MTSYPSSFPKTTKSRVLLVLSGFAVTYLLIISGIIPKGLFTSPPDLTAAGSEADQLEKPSEVPALVVPSLKQENVSWYHENFPKWHLAHYVVDDPSAKLTVPSNKGKEAMVFLTYIIDHYAKLPKYVFFLHSQRFQWHNDNKRQDGVSMLRSFRFSTLEKEGYVNLRCTWNPGCPGRSHPLHSKLISSKVPNAGQFLPHVFHSILPEMGPPVSIGAGCCAQFAASRAQILKRPVEDYIRYRQWLLNSAFDDALSGRIFEYLWHIIFGQQAVHCPPEDECFCNVYGWCNGKRDE